MPIDTFDIFRRPLDPEQRLGMALMASVLLHALMWISLSTYSIGGNVFARPVYTPLSVRIERSRESPKATPVVINDKKASLQQKLNAPKQAATAAPADTDQFLTEPGVSVSDTLYLRAISSRVSSPLFASGEFRRSSDISEKPEVVAMRVPKYPRAAREHKVSGWVVVMLMVDERGKVVDAEAVDSDEAFSDYERDIAEAMRGSTFTPGKLDGRAVKTLMFATVRFDHKDLSGLARATDTSAPVSIEHDEKR